LERVSQNFGHCDHDISDYERFSLNRLGDEAVNFGRELKYEDDVHPADFVRRDTLREQNPE
jgi:hypothetical protein